MGDRDEELMWRALGLAASVPGNTPPNPGGGAGLAPPDGLFEGATKTPGGAPAEAVALEAAGEAARGATLYVTLEPCSHTGRTGPCADAVIQSGVARVVVGIVDPDERVAGSGIKRLREAGIQVDVGLYHDDISAQLAPYLKHRATGRPYVILKLAATLDGRTAAPDGSSQWITSRDSRADAHRLRAESDAVLVGAGTIRADDPALTVRDVTGRDPIRVVLGRAPEDAKVHPAVELSGDLDTILDKLGGMGVLQLLVEGGATVAHSFHAARLVDRYVVYLAPALMGGSDGRGMFNGPGASTLVEA